MTDQNLVEVHNVQTPLEAEIVKNKLYVNGVNSYIYNAEFSNMISLYTTAVGGIRIMVNKKDFKEAKKLIDEHTNHLNSDEKDITETENEESKEETIEKSKFTTGKRIIAGLIFPPISLVSIVLSVIAIIRKKNVSIFEEVFSIIVHALIVTIYVVSFIIYR